MLIFYLNSSVKLIRSYVVKFFYDLLRFNANNTIFYWWYFDIAIESMYKNVIGWLGYYDTQINLFIKTTN